MVEGRPAGACYTAQLITFSVTQAFPCRKLEVCVCVCVTESESLSRYKYANILITTVKNIQRSS